MNDAWDITSQATIAELKGHTGRVVSAVFSPEGSRILTASRDKTARVWDVASQSPVAELGHASRLTTAAFSPDGTRIVTGSEDGTVQVWDSVPYRVRFAEHLANARGENGSAIVAAYLRHGGSARR